MPDKTHDELPFDSENAGEQALWKALSSLPQDEPPTGLRRNFYRALDRASRPGWPARLRQVLGMQSNIGWITTAAAVLLGIGVGMQVDDSTLPAGTDRLAMLEQNVALLNRELILDRLDDAAAGKRLRGVVDAAYVVADDAEVARALLVTATGDSVPSVRTAAIDALGPSLGSATVGNELMRELEITESPLVQLALVDLVLRHGSAGQLEQLLALVESGSLHPDLARHVERSFGSESI